MLPVDFQTEGNQKDEGDEKTKQIILISFTVNDIDTVSLLEETPKLVLRGGIRGGFPFLKNLVWALSYASGQSPKTQNSSKGSVVV